ALRDVGIELGLRLYPMLTAVDDIREEIAARYAAHRDGKGKGMITSAAARTATGRDSEETPESDSKARQAQTKEEKTMTENTSTGSPIRDGLRFEDIARQASGVPVIKLVSTIIEGAVTSGATDIHLDPQDPQMRVRYRIDGVLHDVMTIPRDIENAVISRIKILSDLDITETRHPQDGHISIEVAGGDYDIRVATLPTFLGERVVLRLLDQSAVLQGVGDLGLETEDQERFLRLLSQPYGMIL